MLSDAKASLMDIFISQSRSRVNKIDVMRGLNFVQKSLFPKLEDYSEKKWAKFFFDDEDNPNEKFADLMELWETIKIPIRILNKAEKNRYKILNLIYEVDGYYHYAQYEKLVERIETDVKQRLDDLCLNIEEINNNKIIMFFNMKMKLLYKMILDKFAASIGDYDYIYIKYHLANTMINEGTAIVIAGSEDLTSKRYYGYILKAGDWERQLIEMPAPYRNIFFNIGEDEMNFTELRGIRWISSAKGRRE